MSFGQLSFENRYSTPQAYRSVAMYDPIDTKKAMWGAGMAARDAGSEMQNWHDRFNAEENAQMQAAAARQQESDSMARQQYQQNMAERQAQMQAFQAEERRKQQIHDREMKKRGTHDLYKQTALINAQNAPAMAMAQQFGGIGGQPQAPGIGLYDSGGKRIGGSFSPFKTSLMG